MSLPDLSTYKSVYYRISDGRKFLGKQTVPGQCRMWDTIEEKFTDMSKSAVARRFKGDKSNQSFIKKIKRPGNKVVGAKTRDTGIVHKPQEDTEDYESDP